MYIKRRKRGPSFGPGGQRLAGRTSSTCSMANSSSNRLFMPGRKLVVRRAPIMNGLSCGSSSSLLKKFQRPMLKRRAYKGGADEALKQSSLGVRPRMDGMAKLLARAGRGLHFKLPSRSSADKDDTASSSGESSDEEEEDRPFEPLMVWKSPHQGGEARGLPPTM